MMGTDDRLPDTTAPAVADECARQSRTAARKRRLETDLTAWLDDTRETAGWTGQLDPN